MTRWLRLLLVWGVALTLTAATTWMMVFLGAIDTDHPDPTWVQDMVFGLLFGVATQLGLVLSLWTERRGPAARAVTALLMLPAFAVLCRSTIEFAGDARGWQSALGLVASYAYAVQLWNLGRFAVPRLRPLAAR